VLEQDSILSPSDVEFFMSEMEMKDIAAGMVLARRTLDEALEPIEVIYTAKLWALNNKYEAWLDYLKGAIELTKLDIKTEEHLAEEAKRRLVELQQERGSLITKIQDLRLDIHVALQEIRRLRFEKGKEVLADQGNYLREEVRKGRQEIIDMLHDRRKIAEEIHKIQKEFWETNREELERRVKMFKQELEVVEGHLADARARTANLQAVGVSRTTANFLVWAGYLSFAGVGGVIAGFLQERQREDNILSLIINGLANLINMVKPIQPGQSFWALILGPLVLIALLLIILGSVAGVTWANDWILGKFDPDWQAERDRTKKKGKKYRQPRLQNRFALPTPDIDRKSYVQLLASFPYIILAALIILLFSGLAINPADPKTPVKAASLGLATSYIGVIFALLATSIALLYTTKIIEPRTRKYAHAEAEGAVFKKYLRVNWEFALLVVLMVISLLLAAFLGNDIRDNRIVWGFVALFMSLSSFGLAYGLVQRGLFRDVDKLEEKRQGYRRLIERESLLPTVSDVFDDIINWFEDPEKLNEAIADNRHAGHILDEYKMLYEIKETFADEFEDEATLHSFLSQFFPTPKLSFKSLRLKLNRTPEPQSADYIAAPKQAAAVDAYQANSRHYEERLREIIEESGNAELERQASQNKSAQLRATLRNYEIRKAHFMQDHAQSKSALMREKEVAVMKFISAFSVVNVAFTPEGGPPPPPASYMTIETERPS
jgi:hypothetical protein